MNKFLLRFIRTSRKFADTSSKFAVGGIQFAYAEDFHGNVKRNTWDEYLEWFAIFSFTLKVILIRGSVDNVCFIAYMYIIELSVLNEYTLKGMSICFHGM